MSYSIGAANDDLSGSFTSTYQSPITLACFVKIADHPVAIRSAVNFGKLSNNTHDSYAIRTTATDDQWAATSFDSTSGFNQGTLAQNIDGVWTAIVAIHAGDSSRRIIIGSTVSSEGTGTRVVASGQQHVRLGEGLNNIDDFTGLKIAEVAIWNIALDHTTDALLYTAGNIASGIQPDNLIGFWRLNEDNATQPNLGTDATGDLTVTGATFDSDHPTIAVASAPSLFVVRSGIRLQ